MTSLPEAGSLSCGCYVCQSPSLPVCGTTWDCKPLTHAVTLSHSLTRENQRRTFCTLRSPRDIIRIICFLFGLFSFSVRKVQVRWPFGKKMMNLVPIFARFSCMSLQSAMMTMTHPWFLCPSLLCLLSSLWVRTPVPLNGDNSVTVDHAGHGTCVSDTNTCPGSKLFGNSEKRINNGKVTWEGSFSFRARKSKSRYWMRVWPCISSSGLWFFLIPLSLTVGQGF